MAKKKPATQVNVALLNAISNDPRGYVYASKEDGLTSFQAGLITVDTANNDANGNSAVSLTDAGKQYLVNSVNPEKANKPMFEIITNAAIPPSKRGNRKGAGAPSQYPLDQMQVGNTIFIPVSEKHADPVKQLGSTVSSFNMKHSEVVPGETKTIERTKRGAGNKAALDEHGQKIKETVTVPVRKPTKKLVIRAVKGGEKYGDWTAPADGALIGREV